jgi:hypothetical protein
VDHVLNSFIISAMVPEMIEAYAEHFGFVLPSASSPPPPSLLPTAQNLLQLASFGFDVHYCVIGVETSSLSGVAVALQKRFDECHLRGMSHDMLRKMDANSDGTVSVPKPLPR